MKKRKLHSVHFCFSEKKKKSPFSFGSLTPDLLTVPQT